MTTTPKKTTTRAKAPVKKVSPKVEESAVETSIKNIEEKPAVSTNEIDKLMKLVEQQQETINALKNSLSQKQEIVVSDERDRKVSVVCLYDGISLTLKSGHSGEKVILYGLGDKQQVRYEQAGNIARMNRSFAEKGYFIFEDEEIIKDFGLESVYKNIVDAKILKNLGEIDVDSLERLYKRSNSNTKTIIIDKFIRGNAEGEKGFTDRDKIELLTEITGRDIKEDINQYSQAQRMSE
ncbi:MAG: hypothetical protein PHX50_13875 [Massilibacteroides sp.]|nr:hypothetical protein [Massilibacteroides sp.]